MMLSIIIPTLKQRNSDWEIYLEKVLDNILEKNQEIFNNFDDFEIITIENKLVNEAWNYWVEQAKWDIILIINDDIIIQENVFSELSKIKPWQVYCPYFSRKDNFNKIYSDNGNNIVWFCYWMYKSDWKPIPDDLKIWYWDNYIYEYMNKNIHFGWYIHHFESRTLLDADKKKWVSELIEQDKLNWKNYATS